ncbi:MAG: hypothetical protein DRJ03_00940 [Chloroflexi bacterium]|nr:MAG: hypothetical protein DRJ03_00940 [Chloroflexota bacterium]
MYIDPAVHENIEEETIEMQLGGWVLESHCWNPIDENGFQTCRWCGKVIEAAMIVTKEFPICKQNPVIKHLYYPEEK